MYEQQVSRSSTYSDTVFELILSGNNRYCRNFARDDDVRFTEHAMVRLQESVAQMLAEKGRAGCSAVTPSELDATASANAAGVPLSGFIPTSRYVVSNDPRDTLVHPVVCQSMY